MSRYAPRSYTVIRDTPWVQDGDVGWIGVDTLHERSFLTAGMLARSENKRLWNGPAVTRAGTSFPVDFNPVFEGNIIGSYIYSNVNSQEVMLVATAKDGSTEGCNYVWQLQYGQAPVQIFLSGTHGAGVANATGNDAVEFCQAFDKVLLIRRPTSGQGMLMWDGFKSTDTPPAGHPPYTGTFDPMVLSPEGLFLVPNTWFAEPFQNRVLYYFAYGLLNWRTQFNMSDILDPTSYDDIFGSFRVSAAGSDQITRLLAWQKGTLIAFMRHSVYAIENFTVDATQATQRVLSAKVGSVGNKVPIVIGSEVFFLSEPGGVYKVSQIMPEQISYEPIPISMSIRPAIDRINWRATDSLGLDFVACSASLGAYCFFAVPLDGAEGGNNAVLVYNTVTNQWESVPDWWDDDSFRINALHVTLHDQTRSLFALDYAARAVYLLYDDVKDHINGNALEIRDTIETRGYVTADPGGFKRFQRLRIGMTTSNPTITITAISEGINEEEIIVSNLTKDPTESYVHGRGPTTVDPSAPKLEDYSTPLVDESFAIQDFETLPVGDIEILPAVSELVVGSGPQQQSLERFQLDQLGRWISIRIENTSGICAIGGVAVEGTGVSETLKVVA